MINSKYLCPLPYFLEFCVFTKVDPAHFFHFVTRHPILCHVEAAEGDTYSMCFYQIQDGRCLTGTDAVRGPHLAPRSDTWAGEQPGVLFSEKWLTLTGTVTCLHEWPPMLIGSPRVQAHDGRPELNAVINLIRGKYMQSVTVCKPKTKIILPLYTHIYIPQLLYRLDICLAVCRRHPSCCDCYLFIVDEGKKDLDCCIDHFWKSTESNGSLQYDSSLLKRHWENIL